MRSTTAIFALAAASGLAHADSFHKVVNDKDAALNSDFKTSTSFKAAGSLGAGFAPSGAAIIKDDSPPSIKTADGGRISAREILDQDVKASTEASASASFKAAAGVDAIGDLPDGVVQDAFAPSLDSDSDEGEGEDLDARGIYDDEEEEEDEEAAFLASLAAAAAFNAKVEPVAAAGPAASDGKGSSSSPINARDVVEEEFAAKLATSFGTKLEPVAVPGRQNARPFIASTEKKKSSSSPSSITARAILDNDEEVGASLGAAAALGAKLEPVAVPGTQDARPFIASSAKKSSSPSITARDGPTQQVYGQCGGGRYSGPTDCAAGSKCYTRDASYSQCLPLIQQAYGQCAGNSYFGTNVCVEGTTCKVLRKDYSQCIPTSGSGKSNNVKAVAGPEEMSSRDMDQDQDPKHTHEGEDVDPVHASMSSSEAEMYKTEEASTPAAYTSTASTAAASYVTEDTMMAMPTTSYEEKSTLMTAESSMMATPTSYIVVKTSSAMTMPTAAYGGAAHNGTKTAGSPAASGTTGMDKPVTYEGAASGLMVPGMVWGVGMAVLAGLLM